jgi:hypothetical protein
MRYLKFINESLSTNDLSKDNFYNLLDKNCKQFSNYGEYLQNNLIFRKQEYVGDYFFCNPSLSIERRNVSQYIIDKYFTNDNEVMWDDSLNLLDNINIILNPSINNFKLLNTKETMDYYSTLDEEEGEAAESWFEGPCLMIRYDLSNDLELNINNKI